MNALKERQSFTLNFFLFFFPSLKATPWVKERTTHDFEAIRTSRLTQTRWGGGGRRKGCSCANRRKMNRWIDGQLWYFINHFEGVVFFWQFRGHSFYLGGKPVTVLGVLTRIVWLVVEGDESHGSMLVGKNVTDTWTVWLMYYPW